MEEEAAQLLADADVTTTESEEIDADLLDLAEDLRARTEELHLVVEGADAEMGRFRALDPEVGQRAEQQRQDVERLVAHIDHFDLDRIVQRIEDASTRILHARDRADDALEAAAQAREDADQARSQATAG